MTYDDRIRVMEIFARLNVGGPARQLMGWCERLDTDEFDHRIYSGHVDSDEADHLQLWEAEKRVQRVPGLGRSVKPGDDVRALVGLVGAMRAFRPHVVHTHTAKAGALGRVAAGLAGIGAARAHVFHGHLLHGYFSPLKRRLYVRAERLLAPMTDRLVTVGTRVRDDLLQAGIGRPEQYTVIPPGVRLGPVPDRSVARAALGLPPDVPVVAYVGRLTKVKRLDRFLAVAEAVRHGSPECRFLICGGGELAPEVERRLEADSASFRLLGWRKDVETVYACADVVLLTSDNEGTPITLIEAGMAGVPIVSTRVGSVAEVVRDGQTGLLGGTDVAELAAHTLRLLSDPALARRMGEAARGWTTQAFGVERLAADTQDLYRSLHMSSRRRRIPGGIKR